jgi:hypothetical protein
MKASLSLALFYLSTVVWAGGYQGALERVWLFQAYEIDALNPLDQQTIGFKCRHQLDAKVTTCKKYEKDADGKEKDGWIPCAPHRNTKPPRSRCNFDELTKHMGSAPPLRAGQKWAIYDADGKLNTEETAKNVYTKFTTSGVGKVVNFPPFKAMKGAGIEYNDFLVKFSTAVNGAYSTHRTDANNHLWEAFDDTLEKINIARTGDHGPYLVEAAKTHFAEINPEIKIVEEKFGSNPSTGKEWKTVDWMSTAAEAEKSGIHIQDSIVKFLDGYYRGTGALHKEARKHYQVIVSYKRIADRIQDCR